MVNMQNFNELLFTHDHLCDGGYMWTYVIIKTGGIEKNRFFNISEDK